MVTNQPSHGVLRVQTPLGPRHFQLSFLQSLYLRWIFRNFLTLPVKVLSARQLRFINRICSRQSISWIDSDTLVLGTLEQRPYMEVQNLPARRAQDSASESVPFAADQHQP